MAANATFTAQIAANVGFVAGIDAVGDVLPRIGVERRRPALAGEDAALPTHYLFDAIPIGIRRDDNAPR
jgi:hypothetical protein